MGLTPSVDREIPLAVLASPHLGGSSAGPSDFAPQRLNGLVGRAAVPRLFN